MYTFEKIIGHKNVINNLQNSIAYGKVSHAYIIDGPKGAGKRLLANTFAKTLQCIQGGTTPCNQCISCHAYDSGNHPDILFVKATKTKSLGVDDVREQIGQNIDIKPYQYPYKIYIVQDADTMTVQAQNALLKTIEEPPSYGIFLLLSTNFNRFLPTILSRCVLLSAKPLPLGQVKQYLQQELDISSEKSDLYGAFSQGNIGRAREIATSEEFLDMRQKVIEWAVELSKRDVVDAIGGVKDFEIYKEKAQEVLDILYTWYRDLLVVKQLETSTSLIHKDRAELLVQEAKQISFDKLTKYLDAVQETKDQLRHNANFQLALEVMVLTLKES